MDYAANNLIFDVIRWNVAGNKKARRSMIYGLLRLIL